MSNLNERVSYLGFAPGGLAETDTIGDSTYNSLQAQLKHQFGHGLLLQVAYTWSKELTNINTSAAGSGIQPPGQVIYGAANSNNPLDVGQQYGLASFNRSQRAVISYVYSIPSHRTEGLSGKLLSGWSITGVTTIQNGLPFWLIDGGGGSIYGGVGGSRASLADPVDCNPKNGNCNPGFRSPRPEAPTLAPIRPWQPLPWVNPDCVYCSFPDPYATPNGLGSAVSYSRRARHTALEARQTQAAIDAPCGACPDPFRPPVLRFGWSNVCGAGTGYGNSAIGSITGPGQFNFDMSIIKSTKIWEHGTLEFHVDAFNIFNHAQFNPPHGNDINTPSTFGQITSTSVTPRVMQFGLKYLF